MLMKPLTGKDVQDSLTRLSAATELDQVAVDSLAPERFSSKYDDGFPTRRSVGLKAATASSRVEELSQVLFPKTIDVRRPDQFRPHQ